MVPLSSTRTLPRFNRSLVRGVASPVHRGVSQDLHWKERSVPRPELKEVYGLFEDGPPDSQVTGTPTVEENENEK